MFKKLDLVTPMRVHRMWDTRREQVVAAASRERQNYGFYLDLYPPVGTQQTQIVELGEVQNTLENRRPKKIPSRAGRVALTEFIGFKRITSQSVDSKTYPGGCSQSSLRNRSVVEYKVVR